MGRYIPVLLLGMIGATVGLAIVNYEGDAANAEPPLVAKKDDKKAGKEGSGAVPAGTPAPAPPLARPMRTIALGWEFLAPGVVANATPEAKAPEPVEKPAGSGSSAEKAPEKPAAPKLEATYANAASMDEIESALAKGGSAGGADIAIMPLSSYVASYERLRALSPELIFVVGWSRGREALYGTDARAITKLPATGAIKLAAQAAQPETFFTLFLLDLAGVSLSRVELVAKDAKTPLTAVFRRSKEAPKGKLLVTSADMPHVMPIVAVAPHGFVQAHAADLEQWGRVWLSGVTKLQGDVPAGGRQVATMAGAPPVLSIIEGLGQIEFATLRENATSMGLSGRGAFTLDQAFRTTWRIWRDVGVLTTPPPEMAPLYTGIIGSLARTSPEATAADAPRARTADAGTGKRPEVLLVVKGPVAKAGKLDAEAFVNQIGFLAGVFDRLKLRVSIANDAKTAELLVGMARDRFGLRVEQLSVAKQPPRGASTAVEVLSPN
jgi:hypothetical protein